MTALGMAYIDLIHYLFDYKVTTNKDIISLVNGAVIPQYIGF